MEHHFDIEIANKYGVDEAIIYNHLVFWITKNKANKKNFFDGYHWTYCTAKAFSEIFTYWSQRKISRILNSLISKGLVLKGNYNKINYDRTSWYAVKNEESICQKRHIDLSKMTNGIVKNDAPIPYNITDNITYNITDKQLLFFSFEYEKLWKEWMEYKNSEFKDNFKSKKSEQIAINQLEKLSDQNIETAKEIINQSISNRWKGLFQIKTKTTNHAKSSIDHYKEHSANNLKWANAWDVAEGRQPFSGSTED